MDELQTDGFRRRPRWLLAVAGLAFAQSGLALSLFGPNPWAALTDDRPITSGRHPLHLYHGSLGSRTFYRTGSTACFDPSFQAGYPKTPVFDGGSRPAELFLAAAGGGYRPAAYKVGLFACLVLVPLAFVLAARGAGLPAGAACLSGVGGALLSCMPPVRRLVDEGDLDFYAAGLAAVAFVPWLARYHRSFGIDSWAVLAGLAAVGWYAHPLVWLGLLPLVAVYYLAYAPRHGLAWHLGLLGVTAVGLAPNLWWLWDWGRYWWLRNTPPDGALAHPALLDLLGSPSDFLALLHALPGGVAAGLAAVVGLPALFLAGHRAAAWLSAAAVAIALAAARVGVMWPRAADDAADRGAAMVAGFLVAPAAYALWLVAGRGRLAGALAATAVAGLSLVGWADGPGRPMARALGLEGSPLRLGPTPEQEAIVRALAAHTTAEARILWDEPTDGRPGWNWSALLPQLTGRAFLGGLDPDAGVEHWFCGQTDGRLNGRPLGEWTDAQLTEFCRLYNVGWVVCRSAPAIERWGRYLASKPVARLSDDGRETVIYALDRSHSFVLTGSGRWDGATCQRIALSNLVPDMDGCVTLSLHYGQDLKVYPTYIQLLFDKDAYDPIPRVKLRMPGPVPRVALVWEP